MSEKIPTVLIVDDEEMVVSSLRGMFALQTDYDVLGESDPAKALTHLEQRPVEVVISDFLMPGMNGLEFLKEVKKLQPDSVRLLLTGYADKENAIKAINEVGLYHYLEKPWDNDALLNIVRNALEERSLRQQLTRKVREINQLMNQHDQLKTRHRFLEKELEMAAGVQRSLLPTSFPEVSGFEFSQLYLPCEVVGGDFYDVVPRDDGAVLLVSDVIGHGVQAALTTMLLKGVFQESGAGSNDPVSLLTEMNERLYAVLPESMYAAAAVFFLSATSDEVPFANAGLPYPFVLRHQERLDEIALAGPPLGLFPAEVLPFESRTIQLSTGDVLFSGSDGLGSVTAPSGAMFEDDALRRALAGLFGKDGRTVIDSILEHATEFAEGSPFPDDVNLVALTRT